MAQASWHIKGEYFENCSCQVTCPCFVSSAGLLKARPTEGFCDVALAFHIDEGRYGDVDLAGLNVAIAANAPGIMGEGNWAAAAYLDQRATESQQQALGQIFTGAAGGIMAHLAPLITKHLGAKVVPITYTREGKSRSLSIPNVADVQVEAVPGADPAKEMVLENVSPFAPRVAQAKATVGKFEDLGLKWDNTGKNGYYGAIDWSGPQ
jgi:hypothetical protein